VTYPPSPVPVELESLLLPISDDRPCGESLRYAGTYDLIQTARRSERADLPQGVWKTDIKAADWDEVESLCVDALIGSTKDIQIAFWLTESWMARYGLGGFRHGLELIGGLCERFWADLHPEIRDGDVEYRVAPFVWLAENLSGSIIHVPLGAPRSRDDHPPCSLVDWQTAMRLETMQVQAPDSYEREVEEGKVTRERFEAGAADSSLPIVVDRFWQVRAASDALSAIDDILDRECGKEAPSLRRLKNLLRDINSVFEMVLLPAVGTSTKALLKKPTPAVAAKASPQRETEPLMTESEPMPFPDHEPESDIATFASGVVSGRAQAYRLLAEVADYLARTEPHSPTPYVLRRLVGWENKPIFELMRELVQSPEALVGLHEVLGIPFSPYGK